MLCHKATLSQHDASRNANETYILHRPMNIYDLCYQQSHRRRSVRRDKNNGNIRQKRTDLQQEADGCKNMA